MAVKTPIRGVFSGSTATGLAEFQSGDFIGLTHGGLGASLSIGSAGQVLKVNSGASALEFGSVEAIVNIDGATDLESATLAVGDKLLVSDGGTEGRVLLSQLDTLYSGTTKTLTNKTISGSANTLSNIGNSSLSNSSVNFGGITVALGASDTTPAFDLSDATSYPTSSLTGTITNAQLAGSIANAKLANSSITVTDGSNSTATALGGTITFTAGEGMDVTESSGAITFAGEDATTSNKGIASFSSDNFGVSSGAVTIKDGGVVTAELADDAVTAAKLANTSVSAASYGSSTAIPVITVDAQGRLTSASTASISTDLTIVDTASTSATISLATDTLKIQGTTNEVNTSVSGDTITIGLPDNVTIAGNLTVSGTTTEVSSTTINVADPLLSMATNNNSADAVDIGFYGLYDTSGSQDLYAGLFRDASDSGKFKLFKDNQAEPTTTVNTSGTGYAVGTLVANIEGNITGNVTGNTSGTSGSTTGNAATATILATARNIGGVSFNGSASIDLPGVNSAGNQSTSGTAAISTTVTVADESSDTTCFPLFVTAATGNLPPKSGSNLAFNSDTGILTATGFAGALTGNVTGNTSGTSGSTTGNAATATALQNARNINGVSFDGTANIDIGSVTSGSTSITTNLGARTFETESLDTPVGFITINIGGTNYKLPYYSA